MPSFLKLTAYDIGDKLRFLASGQGQNKQAKSVYGRLRPDINVWATKQRRVNPPFKPRLRGVAS